VTVASANRHDDLAASVRSARPIRTRSSVSRRWFQVNLRPLSVMVVGSVITGYNDLVDSYAGVILAGACWWAGVAVYDRPGRRGIVTLNAKLT
jgi:hypothetical protein